MWDYASAKRIEPLDDLLGDASATSPDYNPKDIFEGVFNAGKWDLKPGSPPGSGKLWCVPLGFELYCLAYNKKYFDEKGFKVPTTLDELSELAVKLKDWNGPGSYGVAVQRHSQLGDNPSRVYEQLSLAPEPRISSSRGES